MTAENSHIGWAQCSAQSIIAFGVLLLSLWYACMFLIVHNISTTGIFLTRFYQY